MTLAFSCTFCAFDVPTAICSTPKNLRKSAILTRKVLRIQLRCGFAVSRRSRAAGIFLREQSARSHDAGSNLGETREGAIRIHSHDSVFALAADQRLAVGEPL